MYLHGNILVKSTCSLQKPEEKIVLPDMTSKSRKHTPSQYDSAPCRKIWNRRSYGKAGIWNERYNWIIL